MGPGTTDGWVAGLVADRSRLARGSTAERVVDVLRERITRGEVLPGAKLSEEALSTALGVSRNTLREAFRLLGHERLLVHEFNRGVFVRTLTANDVSDLYRVRRVVECSAVRAAVDAGDTVVAPLRQAVEAAREAVAQESWLEVGTADLAFHHALAALVGSRRIDELMKGLLAELRLVFHVMANPRAFHEPYVARNEQILDLVVAGDLTGAEGELRQYLDDAERQVLAGYADSDLP